MILQANGKNNSNGAVKNIPPALIKTQRDIIRCLLENGSLTKSELSKQSKLSIQTINYHIQKLKEYGLIININGSSFLDPQPALLEFDSIRTKLNEILQIISDNIDLSQVNEDDYYLSILLNLLTIINLMLDEEIINPENE